MATDLSRYAEDRARQINDYRWPIVSSPYTRWNYITATTLREIAAAARQTVNTSTGCYRVVRADDLLKAAAILESAAAEHLQALRVEAATRDHTEAVEIDRLRAEVAMLRGQLGAVVDEEVRRQLIRCDYVGEHPLTPEDRARVEAETRAAWAAIALAGGA